MTVNLSALGGAGQQFFDDSGVPLTGGKLYSYEAGTTTPQATYTTVTGNVPHSNPIILDAAGRVATGEIWVTAGQNYKFVLKTSTEVTLATWDNITGINGTGIATNALYVQYDPAGVGAVATNVQAKLRQTVSVEDFGAVGDGVTNNTVAFTNAFNSANYQSVLVPEQTIAASGISAEIGRLNSTNVVFSNRNDGILGLIESDYPDAQQMTWPIGEKFVQSFRNGQSSANSIYNAIFPSVNHFDAVQGIIDIAAGSTIEHAVGVSGYVRNKSPSATTGTNGVALFGCATAEANDAAVWGINTLLQDSATRAVGTATGQILVNELDFNVMNPDTQIIGLSIGGNSLAQSSSAIGFIVNSLGTGFKWTAGFLTIDGAADIALKVGAESATGVNIDSQTVIFGYKDIDGIDRTILQQATGDGFLNFTSETWQGLSIQNGTLFLDSGQFLTIAGEGIVTNRQTGWQLPTGTMDRTTFNTATVTLPQLAQRLYALINDLYDGHGLIGA